MTDRFVFVHLPKTGGSFVRRLCDEHEHVRVIDTGLHVHATADEIPAEYAHLPVFAVVRNPWDWYVSWHHFQAALDRGWDLWETFSNRGRLGFELTVLRACGKSIDRPSWLIDELQRHDWDYYTYSWYWTIGGAARRGAVQVGRFERLREDLVAFLDRNEIATEALREAILEAPVVNPSEHGPYQDYYSPELRELVARKCRSIIRTYGYEF